MLRANDAVAWIDTWMQSRPERRVYVEPWHLASDLQYIGALGASAGFYSPLLPCSWGRTFLFGRAAEEARSRRNVQFANIFALAYRKFEALSTLTTVGSLSLAPLEKIADSLWDSLTFESQAGQLSYQADAWASCITQVKSDNSLAGYDFGLTEANFIGVREYDHALRTTLTAPLWTLPFSELPFVVDFASVPNAVAYVFYGIRVVRDVVAGRAMRYGARRRRHRAIVSSALQPPTRVARRFWKAILFKHQRRSPMSDPDAREASLSPVRQGEVAEPFVGRRMLNVYPGKFSIRNSRRVRRQSVCDIEHRHRCNTICADTRKKAVDRVARYSRSVA